MDMWDFNNPSDTKPNLVKGKGSKVRRFLAFDRTCMVNHLAFTARTHVALRRHFFAGYHVSAIFSCYYHWQCICDICTAAILHTHLLFNTPLLPQCHTRVWEVSDGMSSHLLAMVLEWWKQSGSICLALKSWLMEITALGLDASSANAYRRYREE